MKRILLWALSLLPVLMLGTSGNTIYDWLLGLVAGGRAHVLIALTPEAVFMHRATTIGSLILLGLSLGLAMRQCLRPALASRRPLSLLALGGLVAGTMAVTVIGLRGHVQAIAGPQVADASIEIAAIPLYLAGLIPAACLLAAAALLAQLGKRANA